MQYLIYSLKNIKQIQYLFITANISKINLKYHTVNLFMHIMIPIILILNIPIH